MKVEGQSWSERGGWVKRVGEECREAQLVLAFGALEGVERAQLWADLRERWPRARLVGCSTAGEIAGTSVEDGSVVVTALHFERSEVECVAVRVAGATESRAAGSNLAEQLPRAGLRHVLVLSDGLSINGSELVRGLTERLPANVSVTGGLSGDGSRFERTCVALDRVEAGAHVVAIGLYGDHLEVGFGSLGGWDPFGPERLVTRSRGAVLYELDGSPALELYERYLAEYAAQLPASGLLFPLTLRQGKERGVVRTILSVSKAEQSLTFAGDVPEGAYAQLMHANFDRLIEGALGAARTGRGAVTRAPDVAFLISCVGRKLVLQQRIEEEVEAVRDVLGERTWLTGFYSYGEIAPFEAGARCELHNQTMTITTLSER